LLWNPANIVAPHWSHDGRFIMFSQDRTASVDLWVLDMKGNRKPTIFLPHAHMVAAPVFSPDDQWIAYESNASGRWEVYVRPFARRRGEFPISRDGGRAPRWRGNGKEIFFLSPDGIMMTVPVATSHEFSPGLPEKLFPTPLARAGNHHPYAVTKDGQRFDAHSRSTSSDHRSLELADSAGEVS
jgi:dipeptidyl aminopeptidase/acylaminoacyl peptidase